MEHLINNALKWWKSGEKVQIIEWNWRTGSIESIINIFLLSLLFLASALVTVDSGLRSCTFWWKRGSRDREEWWKVEAVVPYRNPQVHWGLQPALSSGAAGAFLSFHHAELTFSWFLVEVRTAVLSMCHFWLFLESQCTSQISSEDIPVGGHLPSTLNQISQVLL